MLDVIQQRESLQRRVAELTADAARLTGGRIEGDHRGRRRGALQEGVERTAVERFAGVARVAGGVAPGEADGFPDAVRLVGAHALAAHARAEQAGDEQGLVPDDLGVEAMARTTGEEAILRILGQEFR